ncbi:MAG: hypothetical protein ACYC3X_11935 [Pirellulaceae bacterium]
MKNRKTNLPHYRENTTQRWNTTIEDVLIPISHPGHNSPFVSNIMRIRICCFAIIFCVAMFVSHSRAFGDIITIVNPSFEDPLLSNNNAVADWNGWQIFGASPGGTWNINESEFWNVPAPDGNNVGYLAGAGAPGESASGTQLLGVNLVADSNYQLSFFVGHPIGYGATLGTQYAVDLRAGGNVLASVSGTGQEGSF